MKRAVRGKMPWRYEHGESTGARGSDSLPHRGCFVAGWVFSLGDLRFAAGRNYEKLHGPAGPGIAEAAPAAWLRLEANRLQQSRVCVPGGVRTGHGACWEIGRPVGNATGLFAHHGVLESGGN